MMNYYYLQHRNRAYAGDNVNWCSPGGVRCQRGCSSCTGGAKPSRVYHIQPHQDSRRDGHAMKSRIEHRNGHAAAAADAAYNTSVSGKW